jgi:O-antigen ligase
MIAGAGTINTMGTTAGASRPIIFSKTDLSHGRLREWKAALETWLDRPLLGAGSGAYYQASAKHQGSSPALFAHDLPLELAAELGAFGLLLAIGVYAACFDVLRRARSVTERWLLGPAVAAFLISNLLDWPWHLAGLGAAWAVAVGALLVTNPGAAPALSGSTRRLVRQAVR